MKIFIYIIYHYSVAVDANDTEPDRQAVHQYGVQQYLHLHVGAVPDAGAAQPARLLLHGGQDRGAGRTADTATGTLLKYTISIS